MKMELSKMIVLRFGLNKAVTNSLVFNRILSQVGYFENPVKLIFEMENEGLVTHEGFLDATSGILKEIKTTELGKNLFFKELKNLNLPNDISEPTMEFLNKMFDIEDC